MIGKFLFSASARNVDKRQVQGYEIRVRRVGISKVIDMDFTCVRSFETRFSFSARLYSFVRRIIKNRTDGTAKYLIL